MPDPVTILSSRILPHAKIVSPASSTSTSKGASTLPPASTASPRPALLDLSLQLAGQEAQLSCGAPPPARAEAAVLPGGSSTPLSLSDKIELVVLWGRAPSA